MDDISAANGLYCEFRQARDGRRPLEFWARRLRGDRERKTHFRKGARAFNGVRVNYYFLLNSPTEVITPVTLEPGGVNPHSSGKVL
jgi:hypothetical protein